MGLTRQYKEEKHRSTSGGMSSVPQNLNPQVTDGGGRNKDDLKADLDEILEEIDSVLEVNAEEFVNAYVQKGGE